MFKVEVMVCPRIKISQLLLQRLDLLVGHNLLNDDSVGKAAGYLRREIYIFHSILLGVFCAPRLQE